MSDDHNLRRRPPPEEGDFRNPKWLLQQSCRTREIRAATVAAVLAMAGWGVRVVDLDLFSPDSAADLEIDLYAAAALLTAYALVSAGVRLLSAATNKSAANKSK